MTTPFPELLSTLGELFQMWQSTGSKYSTGLYFGYLQIRIRSTGYINIPPHTLKVWPVMYTLRSLAR